MIKNRKARILVDFYSIKLYSILHKLHAEVGTHIFFKIVHNPTTAT